MPKSNKAKAQAKKSEDLVDPPSKPLPTPALDDDAIKYGYEIARGEMGVLSFEPYKSLILPYWAFRTVPIATNSSTILWSIFQSYIKRDDFVGADMTRKFIQMGMTRARRYANHKGGKKYGEDGKVLEKWTGEDVDGKRKEKEEASEIFKEMWRRCLADEGYGELKTKWTKEKKDWQEDEGGRKRDETAEDSDDSEDH